MHAISVQVVITLDDEALHERLTSFAITWVDGPSSQLRMPALRLAERGSVIARASRR
jgi:hypothetical protein